MDLVFGFNIAIGAVDAVFQLGKDLIVQATLKSTIPSFI